MFLTKGGRRWPAIAFMVSSLVAAKAGAQEVRQETVASGLQNPWAVAFLPDGRFLVTERAGRLRVVSADGQLAPAVAGLPEIAVGGQGGLLDVVTDSDFAATGRCIFAIRSRLARALPTALRWRAPA